MMPTADRVRRAIHATAEQVTADSIPPFLVPDSARPFASRPGAAGHRRRQWLAPAAAAVSMGLIAAGVLVISSIVGNSRPGGSLQSVPPYYVALTLESPPLHKPLVVDVTVRATATGKVLATVPDPAPHYAFSVVSAAADDRTFVVGAVKVTGITEATGPVRFYLLRFNAASDTVSLHKLPITNVISGASTPLGIALSPNGRYLAVATGSFAGIRVYSLRSGAERSWLTSRSNNIAYLLAPSWAGNSRTLAFFVEGLIADPKSPHTGVYLLNTASRRRGLLSASGESGLRRTQCSPDYFLPRESLIVCTAFTTRDYAVKAAVVDISTRTGKVLRRIRLPADIQPPTDVAQGQPQVGWAGRTGTPVIVFSYHLRPGHLSIRAFVVTGRRVTEIPGTAWTGGLTGGLPAAW
jgi:hypothetical protein